ncbi:MAG TPA: hypothetical protein DD791_09890 [Syntrophomonas sp.]|jgi:hypothetical protein|nr:hypothetical protein [Syntrophomonas sp.]
MRLGRELFLKQVEYFGNYHNHHVENKINDDYFDELVNRFEIPDGYRENFRCYATNLLMGEDWFYDTESAWRAIAEILNAQFPFLKLVCDEYHFCYGKYDVGDYTHVFEVNSSYCGLLHSQQGGGTIFKISPNPQIIYLKLLNNYKSLLSCIDDITKFSAVVN